MFTQTIFFYFPAINSISVEIKDVTVGKKLSMSENQITFRLKMKAWPLTPLFGR